jgi:nuclear pore complex protein Nup53
MSFHTPQSAGNKEQQPFSLLFSPSMKAADGQRHSPLGRSSSVTPNPHFSATPSFGAAREQPTPPSRRRSLTPASSMAKDTPPPPPGDSLLDSPGLGGPSLNAWATAQVGGDAGVEDMSTSPIGGVQQQQHQQHGGVLPPHVAAAVAGDYAAAGRALREYESSWVTVFGFAQADVPLVLREFGKCGDIVQFGSFDDGPHCNWLHINYSNKHAAQRALLRSGDQLSSSCMVGVKPLDAHKREAIERQLGGSGTGNRAGGGGGGFAGGAGRGPALPKLASSRPYQVNAASAQAAVVPLPSKSAWEKVSEFILGI